MTNAVTDLWISMVEIDSPQKIDGNRAWVPILSGSIDSTQSVFVGFHAGDSPPVGDEIEYEGMDEVMWVYKSDYTIGELREGFITPQELFQTIIDEQPNIEIVGLCKYERNLPHEKS